VVTDQGEAADPQTLKELADELDPQQFWQISMLDAGQRGAIDGIARDMRGA